MNNLRSRTRTHRLAAVVLAGSMVFAACSDDTDDPVSAGAGDEPAAEATAAVEDGMAEEEMTDEGMAEDGMAEDGMAEEEMTDEGMGEEAMAPTGDGCAAVPADGEGSFDGMADDPAATAASNNPVLSTLVTAVTEAGLVDTLNGEGPFTIFAPSNDAFAAIPEADLAAVLADTDLLTSILTHHVIAGERWSAADLVAAGSATTVNGTELSFSDEGGVLMVDGASSICMDVPTANATVHIIDMVLMPG